MKLTLLFSQVSSLWESWSLWLLVVVLGLGCLARLFLPQIKGKAGELLLSACLGRKLPKEKYTILDDIYFPLKDGTTTQIDHIVISSFGVFVIETKAYKGWIFGGEKERYWTQTIYRKKSRFQNPLRQNYLHTQTLKELLGLSEKDVKSVIAFHGDAEFKTDMPSNVLHFADVPRYILSFADELIPQPRVSEIVSRIRAIDSAVPRSAKSAHVRNIKRKHGG